MKQLISEIDINATADQIWDILTDFKEYPGWNPFVKSISGNVQEGSRFQVTLQLPGSSPLTFMPKCLKFEKNSEFRWLGHLLLPGLFDGEHIFELIYQNHGKTRFVQRESFHGILVPLLWKKIRDKTKKAFEMMNARIKELAETV